MNASIWIYPWDLIDEGIEKTLDRLAESRLTSISLAVSYHSGKFLRPHSQNHKIYFTEDGVIYYNSKKDIFRDNNIKPEISRLAINDNILDNIINKAYKRNISVIGWTVSLHNSRIGTKYPQFTVKNVYGDSYPYSLCPSNGAVVEYVSTLVRSLSEEYDLEAVELETPGFLPFIHGCHHEMYQVDIRPTAAMLLGLCFCDSCCQQAMQCGIDIERLKEIVKAALEPFYEADADAELDGPAMDMLVQYRAMRCQIVADLVKSAKAAAGSKKLYVIPSVNPPLSNAFMEGSDIDMLASHCDALTLLAYYNDIQLLESELYAANRVVRGCCKLRVGLRPVPPDVPSQDALNDVLRRVNQQQADGVSFYNYGHFRDRKSVV